MFPLFDVIPRKMESDTIKKCRSRTNLAQFRNLDQCAEFLLKVSIYFSITLYYTIDSGLVNTEQL